MQNLDPGAFEFPAEAGPELFVAFHRPKPLVSGWSDADPHEWQRQGIMWRWKEEPFADSV